MKRSRRLVVVAVKKIPRRVRMTLEYGLLDHAALGIFDEFHQLKHVFAEVAFGFDLLQRLRRIEAGVEQSLEGFLDLQHAFLAESATLESDGVGAVGAGLARGDSLGKWQNI